MQAVTEQLQGLADIPQPDQKQLFFMQAVTGQLQRFADIPQAYQKQLNKLKACFIAFYELPNLSNEEWSAILAEYAHPDDNRILWIPVLRIFMRGTIPPGYTDYYRKVLTTRNDSGQYEPLTPHHIYNFIIKPLGLLGYSKPKVTPQKTNIPSGGHFFKIHDLFALPNLTLIKKCADSYVKQHLHKITEQVLAKTSVVPPESPLLEQIYRYVSFCKHLSQDYVKKILTEQYPGGLHPDAQSFILQDEQESVLIRLHPSQCYDKAIQDLHAGLAIDYPPETLEWLQKLASETASPFRVGAVSILLKANLLSPQILQQLSIPGSAFIILLLNKYNCLTYWNIKHLKALNPGILAKQLQQLQGDSLLTEAVIHSFFYFFHYFKEYSDPVGIIKKIYSTDENRIPLEVQQDIRTNWVALVWVIVLDECHLLMPNIAKNMRDQGYYSSFLMPQKLQTTFRDIFLAKEKSKQEVEATMPVIVPWLTSDTGNRLYTVVVFCYLYHRYWELLSIVRQDLLLDFRKPTIDDLLTVANLGSTFDEEIRHIDKVLPHFNSFIKVITLPDLTKTDRLDFCRLLQTTTPRSAWKEFSLLLSPIGRLIALPRIAAILDGEIVRLLIQQKDILPALYEECSTLNADVSKDDLIQMVTTKQQQKVVSDAIFDIIGDIAQGVPEQLNSYISFCKHLSQAYVKNILTEQYPGGLHPHTQSFILRDERENLLTRLPPSQCYDKAIQDLHAGLPIDYPPETLEWLQKLAKETASPFRQEAITFLAWKKLLTTKNWELLLIPGSAFIITMIEKYQGLLAWIPMLRQLGPKILAEKLHALEQDSQLTTAAVNLLCVGEDRPDWISHIKKIYSAGEDIIPKQIQGRSKWDSECLLWLVTLGECNLLMPEIAEKLDYHNYFSSSYINLFRLTAVFMEIFVPKEKSKEEVEAMMQVIVPWLIGDSGNRLHMVVAQCYQDCKKTELSKYRSLIAGFSYPHDQFLLHLDTLSEAIAPIAVINKALLNPKLSPEELTIEKSKLAPLEEKVQLLIQTCLGVQVARNCRQDVYMSIKQPAIDEVFAMAQLGSKFDEEIRTIHNFPSYFESFIKVIRMPDLTTADSLAFFSLVSATAPQSVWDKRLWHYLSPVGQLIALPCINAILDIEIVRLLIKHNDILPALYEKCSKIETYFSKVDFKQMIITIKMQQITAAKATKPLQEGLQHTIFASGAENPGKAKQMFHALLGS